MIRELVSVVRTRRETRRIRAEVDLMCELALLESERPEPACPGCGSEDRTRPEPVMTGYWEADPCGHPWHGRWAW